MDIRPVPCGKCKKAASPPSTPPCRLVVFLPILGPDGNTQRGTIVSRNQLTLSTASFEEVKKAHPRTALKLTLSLAQDLAERLREAKGPLREFLVWQISKR